MTYEGRELKTIYYWILLMIVLALGVGYYLIRSKRESDQVVRRVGQMERPTTTPVDTSKGIYLETPPTRESTKVMLERHAQALRDSVDNIRADLLASDLPLSSRQEAKLAELERHAKRLDSLARAVKPEYLPDDARLEMYRSCLQTYGAGSRVCQQLRQEIGLKGR
jgi:hypothetical protein